MATTPLLPRTVGITALPLDPTQPVSEDYWRTPVNSFDEDAFLEEYYSDQRTEYEETIANEETDVDVDVESNTLTPMEELGLTQYLYNHKTKNPDIEDDELVELRTKYTNEILAARNEEDEDSNLTPYEKQFLESSHLQADLGVFEDIFGAPPNSLSEFEAWKTERMQAVSAARAEHDLQTMRNIQLGVLDDNRKYQEKVLDAKKSHLENVKEFNQVVADGIKEYNQEMADAALSRSGLLEIFNERTISTAQKDAQSIIAFLQAQQTANDANAGNQIAFSTDLVEAAQEQTDNIDDFLKKLGLTKNLNVHAQEEFQEDLVEQAQEQAEEQEDFLRDLGLTEEENAKARAEFRDESATINALNAENREKFAKDLVTAAQEGSDNLTTFLESFGLKQDQQLAAEARHAGSIETTADLNRQKYIKFLEDNNFIEDENDANLKIFQELFAQTEEDRNELLYGIAEDRAETETQRLANQRGLIDDTIETEKTKAAELKKFDDGRVDLSKELLAEQKRYHNELIAAEQKRSKELISFERTKHQQYIREKEAAERRQEEGNRKQVLSSLGFNNQQRAPIKTPTGDALVNAGRGGRKKRLAYR